MDNTLYEYGGVADVLIKCKTARTIGGVEYAEGEPYTMLKDVRIQLNYEQHEASASAKKPVMDSLEGRPYELIISGAPLTHKIANLMLSEIQDEYTYTKRETVTCWETGQIQLSNEIAQNGILFCYDSEFNVIPAQVQQDRTIINGDFSANAEYLIFYTVVDSGNAYKFEIPYYAYFSIEIFAKGNSNKTTNNIYMSFDAATLTSVPNFNILSGGLLNTPLVFKLIYQYQKEPIVVFN